MEETREVSPPYERVRASIPSECVYVYGSATVIIIDEYCVSSPPPPLCVSAAVELDGLMFVIGGKECSTIEYYNPRTGKWTDSKVVLQSTSHYMLNAFVLSAEISQKPEDVLNFYTTE